MKKIVAVLLPCCFSLILKAQNVGIGITTPLETLHVDSVIKIGKNETIPDSSRKNLLKFGDGNFVTIGEEYLDDQLNIKFGTLVFSTPGGATGNGYLGIQTSTPTSNLDLNGSLRIRGNNAAAGKVLTSMDAAGNAVWQTAGLSLPYSGTSAAAGNLFSITATGVGTPGYFQVNNAAGGGNALAATSNGFGAAAAISNTGSGTGMYATAASTLNGTVTTGATGAWGEVTSIAGGTFSAGVRGINRSSTGSGIGVVGYQAGGGYGVYGETPSGTGIYGTSATGTGGYFTTSGSGKALHTQGPLQLAGISEAAGKVLTSDATGNATWQNASLTLPYNGTVTINNDNAFTVNNNGTPSSAGVFYNFNVANTLPALQGISYSTTTNSVGVAGTATSSTSGVGVKGTSSAGYGVRGDAQAGYGVAGFANAAGGNAGYFLGQGGASALLTVGAVRLSSISEGAGKVLTSDATGNATWQSPSVVKFSATQAAAFNVPYNSYSIISFSSEDYDASNAFASGVFTAPAAGIYHFDTDVQGTANVAMPGNATLLLRVNGQYVRATDSNFIAGEFLPALSISCDISLAAGGTVSVVITQQNSGAAPASIGGSSSEFNSHFTGHRVN